MSVHLTILYARTVPIILVTISLEKMFTFEKAARLLPQDWRMRTRGDRAQTHPSAPLATTERRDHVAGPASPLHAAPSDRASIPKH